MNQTIGFLSGQLFHRLREQIVTGEYPLGSRLPTCKELMKQHDVSICTAYKALAQLEREGYITLKKHVGSTVSYIRDAPKPRCKVLNLVTSNFPYPLVKGFLEDGQRLFGAADWKINTFSIPREESLPADVLLAVNSPDAYSIFFDVRAGFRNTQASQEHFYERAIYLGDYLADQRLTSITCDEAATVRIALEYFRSLGRTNCALFCYMPDSVTENLRRSCWQSDMMAQGKSLRWCLNHAFYFPITPVMEEDAWMETTFREMLAKGQLDDLDAVFIPYELHAIRFQQLCEDHGIAVPKRLAIITLGNIPQIQRGEVTLPWLDNRIIHHLEFAREILEARMDGDAVPPQLFTYCPKLHLPSKR